MKSADYKEQAATVEKGTGSWAVSRRNAARKWPSTSGASGCVPTGIRRDRSRKVSSSTARIALQWIGWAAAGLSLLLCGCAILGKGRPSPGKSLVPPRRPLASREIRFADALATFAVGLIADMRDDPDAVLTNCLRLIALDPDNDASYLRAALAYLEKGQSDKAIDILEQLRRRKRRNPLPYIYLAIVYETMGQSNQAVRCYQKAIRLGSDDPVPYQRLASWYLSKNNFEHAAAVLEQGLKSVGDSPSLLTALADVYLLQAERATSEPAKTQALADAARVVEKLAQKAATDNTTPLWNLAGIYADMHDYRKVVDTLARIATVLNDEPVATASIAYWVSSRDDWQDIVTALKKTASSDPGNLNWRLWLAAIYRDKEEIQQAVALYRSLLNEPDAPRTAYIDLARILLEKNDEGAQEVIKEGLQRFPDDADLHNLYAYFLFSRQQYRDAVPAYEAAEERLLAQSRKPNTAFYLNYALAALNAGSTEVAARQLAKAIELNPGALSAFSKSLADQPEEIIRRAIDVLTSASAESELRGTLLFLAAVLQIRLQDFEQAYHTFQKLMPILTSQETRKNLRESGVLDDLYFYYGMVAERTGHFDEAVRHFERCIEINPDAAEALNYVAYMWAEHGTNLIKAHEYVKRALSKDPENPAYIDTLGWIHYMRGDYSNALEEIQRAYNRLPRDPTIAEHLGDVHARLDNMKEALKYWIKALQLEPDNAELRRKLEGMGLVPDSLLLKESRSDAPEGPTDDFPEKQNLPQNAKHESLSAPCRESPSPSLEELPSDKDLQQPAGDPQPRQ